ncbi:MAG: glycosyltransferase [Methanobrevibacter sp.]|jgi:glycosyltransferase involved in cell wall biosynthesis|nr:glycosyltransferase [Methanobrevibacter sp.]
MSEIEVSVIFPIFNNSKYLDESLTSLINQNFKEFEIIVVNDGSTDNSLEITEKILSKTKISYKIISQKNQGVSAARNLGLNSANGKYILFLDSDDKIDLNHINYLYNSIKNNKTDFAFTNILKFNSEGDFIRKKENYKILEENKIISTQDLIKLELEMKIPFSFTQILYKTSILKENNLLFDEKHSYGEDTEFALKSLINGKNVAITNEFTYFYRIYPESTSSKKGLQRFQIIAIFEDLINYFKEYNLELEDLIKFNRIPKAIFGNLMYLFYNGSNLDEVLDEMEKLNLFFKLSNFKLSNFRDILFFIKSKFFLLNPRIYYKLWRKFKNSIK